MSTAFEMATSARDVLETAYRVASGVVREFPKDDMGLGPLAMPQYQSAKATASHAFAQLRAFNLWYVKAFKKETRQGR